MPRQAMVAWSWAVRQVRIPQGWLRACGRRGQSLSYPGLYTARCEQSDGASWLNVTKATGPADHRPTVTESGGPAYGYHVWDLSLAQDNLVSDVTAAEITWTRDHG
jgi:hypothetical protein